MTVILHGGFYINSTPERERLLTELMKKEWFLHSSLAVQMEIAQLPTDDKVNHDGFIADLVNRPSSIGTLEVLFMTRIARGNFGLTPIFKVRNENGTEYEYEYFSWRYGVNSGAKGIVFVRDENRNISHFVALAANKFATGQMEWSAVGGFIDLTLEGVTSAIDRMKVEIQQELGLPDIEVEEVYDLGVVAPDAGMSNQRPALFAAFLDGSQAAQIADQPLNPDEYELKAGAQVFPIGQITEFLRTADDGYFLTAFTRALVDERIGSEIRALLG